MFQTPCLVYIMDALVEKLEALLEWGGLKKDIAFLVISCAALVASFLGFRLFEVDLSWVAIILCGVPIVVEATIGLITRFDIKADVLVSLALVASVAIGEDFAAGEVAFIMQLGALLEDLTVAKARAGIERLVKLTPQTARVIKDGVETVVEAKNVLVGDIVRVLAGETIPVDGVIVLGKTSVNQAVMTGESLPVDKGEGDEVSSGTVNQFGTFEMRALKVGEDSSIQRMIRLVQSADAGKARIVRMADRWATWIVVTALTVALGCWLVTGEVIRSVTVLVVFCPCALVLATPTAVMAAIGNVAKRGLLVREGDALERLAAVRVMTFDKTGTLTLGKPHVVYVESSSEDFNEEALFRITAAAEQLSEHPLGKAVVDSFRSAAQDAVIPPNEKFVMRPGLGISAVVEGHEVQAGNEAMVRAATVDFALTYAVRERIEYGCTVINFAIHGSFAGALCLADTLRSDSASIVAELKALGVSPVLATGDNELAAQAIARQTGISEVRANAKPEEKLQIVRSLEDRGRHVCMVGDGINDAPALKAATVGIAMGGVGSDIAIDAADIVLVDDEVRQLPHLVALSRRMMRTIKLNLTFSMALNFLAIALAVTAVLNPVTGALVHNAGSVFVIVNSALLLRWQKVRGSLSSVQTNI